MVEEVLNLHLDVIELVVVLKLQRRIYMYEVSNCSACCVHAKNTCVYLIWTSNFEIIATELYRSMIKVEEVLNYRMAIIDYNKSIIRITM